MDSTPASSMGCVDPARKYGIQHKTNRNNFTCNFCYKVTKGGACRLKQHLVGGFRDVTKCSQCPEHVREEVNSFMMKKQAAKEESESASHVTQFDSYDGDGENDCVDLASKLPLSRTSKQDVLKGEKGEMNFHTSEAFKMPTKVSGAKKSLKCLKKTKPKDVDGLTSNKPIDVQSICHSAQKEAVVESERKRHITEFLDQESVKKQKRLVELAKRPIEELFKGAVAHIEAVHHCIQELGARAEHTLALLEKEKALNGQLRKELDESVKAGKQADELRKQLQRDLDSERAKREAAEKALADMEAAFPEHFAWHAREHPEDAVRAVTAAERDTQLFMYHLNRSKVGQAQVEAIGSYGYMCGQKAERTALYTLLRAEDPDFQPSDYGLPEPHAEDPPEPFKEPPAK